MPAHAPDAATPDADPRFAHVSLSPSFRRLAARGLLRSYRRGTVLIEEGDVGELLYIVLEGQLKVYSANRAGHEIIHGVYGPGEYVGEMSLDGGPRSASVATLVPTTCVLVTRQTLQSHIADEPEIAFELLTKVIRRARAATLSAKQLALNSVYGRLVEFLDSQAEAVEGERLRRIPTRLAHRDVAGRIGCSREMVSRVMRDLENGGWVREDGDGWLLAKTLPTKW